MSDRGLTAEELMAESAIALPDKEVVSILDLNVDVDVLIDAASPIDLAAAQLNVAAPIDAAAGANVLSTGSTAIAEVNQHAPIDQTLNASATAYADQMSFIDQADDAPADPAPPPPPPDDGGTVEVGDLATLEGPLLNVNVDVDLDADLAAPIAGAVAANANVAAPISASVAANVGSTDSIASALSNQDALITQHLSGDTVATSLQDSSIDQGTTQPDIGGTASTATEATPSSASSAGASGDSAGGSDSGTSSGDSASSSASGASSGSGAAG